MSLTVSSCGHTVANGTVNCAGGDLRVRVGMVSQRELRAFADSIV